MPHAFPPYIKDWLKTYMPPTHKMWWMRTVVLHTEPKTVRTEVGSQKLYFRFTVRDIDAPADDVGGYSYDIHTGGNFTDFRPNDRISLFGHEPIDATHISFPRFVFDHELLVRGACFQTRFVDSNEMPDAQLYAEKHKQTSNFSRSMQGLLTPAGKDLLRGMNLNGGVNLEPIYQSLAPAINEYILSAPDPDYVCVNPRPKNSQGGALVD